MPRWRRPDFNDAPDWYPTGARKVTRWRNGQAWTDYLTVSGYCMVVTTYRSRARVTAIGSLAVTTAFALVMIVATVATRSTAVLWAGMPLVIVCVAGAITLVAIKANMRRQIRATGIL